MNHADLRQTLRAATDEDHRALDTFMGNVWETRADYVSYIAMNHVAHWMLEPAVEGALDRAGARQRYEPLRFHLDADLKALGVGPSEPLPVDRFDLAGAIGAIYVLEGSRLGARMIHRMVLDASWNTGTDTAPSAFFGAARSTVPFSARIAAFGPHILDKPMLDDAVSGARAAFAIFREVARRTKGQGRRRAAQDSAP